MCMQHINGVTYSDIMRMPTYERRFFLGMLTREKEKRDEMMEKMMDEKKTKGSKGSRSTRISGDALKSKLNSGEITI